MRGVPAPHQFELRRPAGGAAVQQADRLDKGRPQLRGRAAAAGMSPMTASGSAAAMASNRRAAVAGPTPGMSWITRKPATRSRGFSAQRRNASTSLTWAASRNLSPPNLTNGILRRVSSTSRAPL